MNALVTISKDLAVARSALDRTAQAVQQFRPGADNAGDAKNLVAMTKATDRLLRSIPEAKALHCDSGGLVVEATRKYAECEAIVKRARPKGRPGKKVAARATIPKSQKEAESKRAPLAKLGEEDAAAYVAACKKRLDPPTVAGAARIARLEPPDRKAVIAAIAKGVGDAAAVDQVKQAEADAKGNAVKKRLAGVSILDGRDPVEFDKSMRIRSYLAKLAEFCDTVTPAIAVSGAYESHWPKMRQAVQTIGPWIAKLDLELKKRKA